MDWKNTPLHVIDFEGSTRSGILEFGVVTLREGEVAEVHTALCAPTGPVAELERRQHGIEPSALAGVPSFITYWPLFVSLRRGGYLVAHHAPVESGLIRRVWPYPGDVPDFRQDGATVVDWGPWIDTCVLYQSVYPGLDSYKLQDLVRLFELAGKLDDLAENYCPAGRRRWHCALYDALASALLLQRLGALPEMRPMSLQWLVAQSASSGQAWQERSQAKLW